MATQVRRFGNGSGGPGHPGSPTRGRSTEALRESEARYQVLIENALDGIFVFDLQTGRILEANPAYAQMLRYEPSQLTELSLYDIVEDTSAGIDEVLAKFRRGELMRSERRHKRSDGTVADVEVHARLMPSRGRTYGCAFVQDITARKRQERMEADRARVLELVARDGPLDETLDHLAAMVRRFCGGVTCHIDLMPLRRAPMEGEWVAPMPAAQGAPRGCVRAQTRPPRHLSADERLVLEVTAQLASLALDQKELNERLSFQAQHDELTGLPNRRLFEDRLQLALERARRTGQPLAVLWVDLDRFKQVNDTLGHAVGDKLLVTVSQRMAELVRPGDTLARLGGDEFALIAEQLERPGEASEIADALLGVLRQPADVDGYELFVSGSIGIATFPGDGEDAAALQRSADVAMYRAKADGRNARRSFTAELTASARERMELEAHLRRALANGEMSMAYQPELSLRHGLVGFEALMRWNSPRLGPVSPGRFIPVAEESGLIVELGAFALREACRQLAVLGPRAGRLKMAINVSPVQFVQADFVDTVTEAVRSAGITPHRLELELTESMVMQDYETSSRRLSQLRELGVAMAIDDFGTGYSSLSHLHRLPIDTLKVDQSFVRDLDGAGQTRPLVEAIVALARSLQLSVVAEGVETPEQLRFLARTGCDRVQGYLLSRPKSAAELGEWLADPEHWRSPLPGFGR